MTYSEKLRDPRWQKKRLDILSRDKWKCSKCKCDNKTLHVHHIRYIKGLEPWEYNGKDLTTLCETCHAIEHELIPDEQIERKYEHLLIFKEEPDVLASINSQIDSLNEKLKNSPENSLMEEILKNIMYLRNKKIELLSC